MEKERKNTRRNRGITLIALVITVIILLILAGISIAELTGTGIFAKAKEAKQKYKDAEELENQRLADYEAQLNSLGKSTVGSGDVTGGEGGSGDNGDGEQNDKPTPSDPNTPATSMTEAKQDDMFEKTVNSTVKDEYDNQVVVPAGFKITEDANNVTEGIVIIDKEGNEFVWIPVGAVMDSNKTTHTIILSRYTFNDSGYKTDKGETPIDDSYSIDGYKYKHEEKTTSTKGVAVAKDLAEFKNSAKKNYGYYIGRYEARKNSDGSKVTEKGSDTVWSSITQSMASTNCQAMYSNNKFTSDLMNSYAWDTAIVFLQEFDDREGTEKSIPYSRRERVISTFASTGTNNNDISTQDEVCNIYDMASNVIEWTTETSTYWDNGHSCYKPATQVGGLYDRSGYYTSYRSSNIVDARVDDQGFRPILYCTPES